MFLQAAGYPDVVDTQEAAAGEGDIPGGVWGEHGFRAPLNAGVGGGGGKEGEAAGLLSHHTAPERAGRRKRAASRCCGRTQSLARRGLLLGCCWQPPSLYEAAPALPSAGGGAALRGGGIAPPPAEGGKLPAPPSNPSSGDPLPPPSPGRPGPVGIAVIRRPLKHSSRTPASSLQRQRLSRFLRGARGKGEDYSSSQAPQALPCTGAAACLPPQNMLALEGLCSQVLGVSSR